jgi:hypothetical protein
MDLLQSLQAFADLKQAEVSKKDRTELAKKMGYPKDPLEMSLEEYAKDIMKDAEKNDWYPQPERSLLAARMLQNLPGVGVLSNQSRIFSNTLEGDLSPLAQQAAAYYLGQPIKFGFLGGPRGQTAANPFSRNAGEVRLNAKFTSPRMSMLEYLNTLAHEQAHSDEIFNVVKNIESTNSPTYTQEQLNAIPNPGNGPFQHHDQFRNFNIEAPLLNEAKLALQNKEQIPEWMFTWQPLLLQFLNELQKDKPKTEEQLIQDLFINKEAQ